MTREKAEIAADFMTIFYHLQIGHTGNARVPDTAGPILARMLFGHGQGAIAANVLCRSAAGWDGRCAESGEAALIVVGDAVTRWTVSSAQGFTER